MAGDGEQPVAAGDNNGTASEEVKPYKIHVSYIFMLKTYLRLN